jgi:hypothetical protein
MKLNSNASRRRTRRLLVIAQLLTLAYFALGLAFTFVPTPLILFLFASLSPVLAPAGAFILVKQWISSYQRRVVEAKPGGYRARYTIERVL